MLGKSLLTLACFSFLLVSCTKLNEKYNGSLTEAQVQSATSGGNADALLKGVYNSMQGTFQGQEGIYALWEMTTDELIGPTRGGDWDDNGAWRVLHAHKFDGDHVRVREVFDNLNGTVFAATDMLRFNPTAQQAAEARLLRAMANFYLLDGYNQIPMREPGESLSLDPKVKTGTDALTYIISEITAIMHQKHKNNQT